MRRASSSAAISTAAFARYNYVMTVPDEWFWPRVEVTGGCWEWQGAKNADGYGQIPTRWHTRLAHRVSFELHYGAIPPGLIVLHGCDNRICVRPAHLSLGTPLDNMRDKESKGRANRHHGFVLGACKKGGHPFTPENTVKHGTRRECRTCKRAYVQARRARGLLG